MATDTNSWTRDATPSLVLLVSYVRKLHIKLKNWKLWYIPVGVHGFGDHIWDIDPSKISTLLYECKPLDHLSIWELICITVYICEVFYVSTNGLVKVSLLLLYLRIFPDKKFQRYVWLSVAFVAMTAVTFTFTSSLQCMPPQKAWDSTIKEGHCFTGNNLVWAHAGFGLVQDLIIFTLPITQIRGLQMSRWKKITVAVAFTFGSLWVMSKTNNLSFSLSRTTPDFL